MASASNGMTTDSLSFVATDAKGKVSAMLQSPDNPVAVMVLCHGAGAGMQHSHMQGLADTLEAVNVASFRFNFPYMQAGGNRTDNMPICVETIGNAVNETQEHYPDLPCFLGGHSFGGRMSSHFVAEKGNSVAGLMYFSFPLHPANKPAIERADHLAGIRVPQLFLSGTRDDLAELTLLRGVVAKLPNATLHEIDTADHGFKVLKRSRKSPETVYEEIAGVMSQWIEQLLRGART